MPKKIKQFDSLANYRRNQLRSTQDATQDYINRLHESHRLYYGLNNGQWDAKAVEILRNRNAPINTFNFIRSRVDGLLGALLDVALETNFETETGFDNGWGKIFSTLIKYDRGRGRWGNARRQYLRDGLIHTGIREMYVDYTHSRFGNVGMRSRNPAYVYFDPYWQSEDINDCRFIQMVSWLTAEQIKFVYNTKSQEIDEEIKRYKYFMRDRVSHEDVIKHFDRTPEFYDQKSGRFLVIQTIQLKKTKKPKFINQMTGEVEEFIDPIIAEFRTKHLGETYNRVDLPHVECTMDAVAPGISTTLSLVDESTPHPVQIGRYPIFTWSAYNLYGEKSGIVELLKDAQTTYNKRESLITHELGVQSAGVYTYEESTFPDDQAEREFKMRIVVLVGRAAVRRELRLRDGAFHVVREPLLQPVVEDLQRISEETGVSFNL